MVTLREVLREIWHIKELLIVVLTPLVCLPLPVCIGGKESSCAYVIIIMAVFWVTEALPINVTALFPVFMFPLTGVLSAGDVGAAFFNTVTLMFIGGMMVAVAIEEWKIHNRIALKILILIGTKPVWILLGLMLTAWFLSMWISNTATTAMMLPIAIAILEQLRLTDINENSENYHVAEDNVIQEEGVPLALIENHVGNDGDASESSTISIKDKPEPTSQCNRVNNTRGQVYQVVIDDDNCTEQDQDVDHVTATSQQEIEDGPSVDNAWTNQCKAFSLCIAYAANIGGTGSLTGTTPNLVLKSQIDKFYEDKDESCPLTFGSWLLFGAPTSLVIVLLSWVWLQFYFFRCSGISNCAGKPTDVSRVRRVLQQQYKQLGKLNFGQIAVVGHFVALATLWITRDLGGSFGWAQLFQKKFVKDSVPALLVGCSLFIFPSAVPKVFNCGRKGLLPKRKSIPIRPLLLWDEFNKKMPWGVVFLLGGGFSIAKASQASGLSAWIGDQLSSLENLQPWILVTVLCFIVATATEVTSNTATTALMLPILSDLAIKIGLSPLYLMFPVTVASSYAFMLPVATPPNAIVFSYGYIKVWDMVKAGSMLNIIAVITLIMANETLGRQLFYNSAGIVGNHTCQQHCLNITTL